MVDHSYDYDPFGAVLLTPTRSQNRLHRPRIIYVREDYSVPVKNEPRIHVRAPIDAGVKKSAETYFNEPGRYTPPELDNKETPIFEETEMEEKPKFNRNPTPLRPPPQRMGRKQFSTRPAGRKAAPNGAE